MLGAFLVYGRKTRPDLHPFHGINAHQSVRNFRVETIKYGLTQSGPHTAGNNSYLSAYGIALFTQRLHVFFHGGHFAGVGTKEGILVNLRPVYLLNGNRTELRQVSAYFNTKVVTQIFFGDAASGHTHGRLPCGGAPAAALMPRAVR